MEDEDNADVRLQILESRIDDTEGTGMGNRQDAKNAKTSSESLAERVI